MRKVHNKLAIIEASLNGSLNGLELDNTSDVIEKSSVIEMINDLKILVNQAHTAAKETEESYLHPFRDIIKAHTEKLNTMKLNRARAEEEKWTDAEIHECEKMIQVLALILSDLNQGVQILWRVNRYNSGITPAQHP
jgi:type III secretory pathway component EscR